MCHDQESNVCHDQEGNLIQLFLSLTSQKVEELREELSQEHQRHVRDIQERARQDLEVKITELQARHNHEMQQLQQQHQHRLQDALAQQQQELEKEHKTEINCLRVQHQQEIDRLRNEELGMWTRISHTAHVLVLGLKRGWSGG